MQNLQKKLIYEVILKFFIHLQTGSYIFLKFDLASSFKKQILNAHNKDA